MLDKNRHTHTYQTTTIFRRKRFLLLTLLGIAVLLALLVTMPDENQGTPNLRTDEKNCGVNDNGCHQNHEDSTLTTKTSTDPDDPHFFSAPLFQDGEKLREEDYQAQAKAVALEGGLVDYIHWLNDTGNGGLLDLTNYGPEDNESFWVAYGYRDKYDTIHIHGSTDAYTFEDWGDPVPRAKISLDPDFPDDPQKTIFIEEGDDHKVLTGSLDRDSRLTIYFSGEASTHTKDRGLEYWWDIDADGVLESGDSGQNRDERGMTQEFEYSEPGVYDLLFRVADGKKESPLLRFSLDLEKTEFHPELHARDFQVEDEDGRNEDYFEKGSVITLVCEVENNDNSGYGEDTERSVLVSFFYAAEPNFDEWEHLGKKATRYALADKSNSKLSFDWDTSELEFEGERQFKFKAIIDPGDEIEEWNEENNEMSFNELVTVYYFPVYPPDLSFDGDITLSYLGEQLLVNTDVNIDVHLENLGLGDASNVRVYFYVDGIREGNTRYFDVAAQSEDLLSVHLEFQDGAAFQWSPSQAGNYTLSLELIYRDLEGNEHSDESRLENVQVKEIPPPEPPEDSDPDIFNTDGWSQTQLFMLVGGVAGALLVAGAVFIFKTKYD